MTTPVRDRVASSLSGAYTIDRELGGGGMSRVFVATDPALDRRIVVKVLSPELAQGISAERFAREIKLAAALQDPHIVPLLSAGTTDGLPYYTMPYVEGESLRTRMQQGPVPLEDALRILRDVAEALEYAHAHGVVHRDIKPENVLLAGRSAVVADFGIAKAVNAARTNGDMPRGATLTSIGTSLGTPAYMAPEQAVGDVADHRADLYAWGMLAYELLAGRHPFVHRTTPQQLVTAHLSEAPQSLDEARPGLPPALGALVMRCLAKDANARPSNAAEVLAALGGTSTSGTYAPIPRMASGRKRTLIALGAAAVLALVVVAGILGRRSASAATASSTNSLAVLPFEHQGDSVDAYLTDGITDEIRGKLTGVHGLSVIARASSNQYKATKKTAQEIAKELGVRYLLTGTVRVVGTGAERRVLVRPELVEVSGNAQPESKWQQPFDAPATDVIKVQRDIAGQVVGAMEVAVSGTDQAKLVRVSTRDPVAYDLYLRGRAAVNFGISNDPASQRNAISLYEQAVARDSNLTEAWGALAVSRALLFVNGMASSRLGEQTREAAERTRALDPNGAEGHRAMGVYYRFVERDFARGLAENEAARRAVPGDVRAITNVAYGLDETGRPAESLALLNDAARLDPRNGATLMAKAALLSALGRLDEARATITEAVAVAPATMAVWTTRVRIELAKGDLEAARRTLALCAQNVPRLTFLTNVGLYGLTPLTDDATRREIRELAPSAYGDDRATWSLVRARMAWWDGDATARRVWADTAVRYLSALVREVPNDAPTHGDYAEALGHAGRGDDAVREAQRSVDLTLAQSNGVRGRQFANILANAIFATAVAGRGDVTVKWLEELQPLSRIIPPARVRVDPWFRDIQNDPGFQRFAAGGAR